MGRRRKLAGALALVLALAGGAAIVVVTREPDVRGRIFTVDDAPAREIAIVLGTKPGSLLVQRMDAACALVRRGGARKLVLTGLAEEMPYMRERAQGCGAEVLADDGASRTLENLRRSRDLFGITSALVVTQRFHLGRALYLADALGIDAVGVVAAGEVRSWSGRLRERFARARARLDVLTLR